MPLAFNLQAQDLNDLLKPYLISIEGEVGVEENQIVLRGAAIHGEGVSLVRVPINGAFGTVEEVMETLRPFFPNAGLPGRDGVDGQPGKDGRDGLDGRDGRDGVDGKDGQPGKDGVDGTPGKDGIDGTPGERGQDGRDGAGGQDGLPGRDGRDGADGGPGERGERGLPGLDAKDGQPGRDGKDGRDGADGAAGRDGKDGQPGGRGEKGEAGGQGLPGRDGKDGAKGEKGDRGERGEKGDRGEQGIAGRDGGNGVDGQDGKRGPMGLPGRDGKGEKGDRGEDGIRGLEGEVGPAGKDGRSPQHRGEWAANLTYVALDIVRFKEETYFYRATSKVGQPPNADPAAIWMAGVGPRGYAGDTGAVGQGLVWRGTWSGTQQYRAYDIVHRSGSAYIATRSSLNEAPPSDAWGLFAEKGEDGGGGGGSGINWLGPWDGMTTYEEDDAVEHNGSSYIAVAENTDSEPPSADWNLMAAKGDTGEQGIQGIQGIQGEQGETGDAGAAGQGLTWRGVWNAMTAYVAYDLVEHEGSSYITLTGDTGTEPPASPWELVAQKGDTGEQGIQGIQGIQGEQGIQGIQGVTGDAGADGVFGGGLTYAYTFSTTTADADPGSGLLRLNQATQNTSAFMYIDLNDAFGNDITAALDSMNNGGTLGLRFQLRLSHRTDSTKYLNWDCVEVEPATGYRKILLNSVLAQSGASPFSDADPVLITATLIGAKGATGNNGNDGVNALGLIGTATKTSTYSAVSGDLVRCSTAGGAFTVTLPASPTVGDVVGVALDVAGSDLTISRAGSQTFVGIGIVGGTSIILKQAGATVLFLYTASNEWTIISDTRNQDATLTVYVVSSSFTLATGAWGADVHAVAGGGGGGAGARKASGVNSFGGGGGGGGEYRASRLTAATIGASAVTVTVGGGGSSGVYSGTNDANGGNAAVGGNSSFGSHVVAVGGGAGQGGTTTTGTAGAGGTGGTGTSSAAGGAGGAGGGGGGNGGSGAGGGSANAGAGGGGGWGMVSDNVTIRTGGFGGTAAGLGGPWGTAGTIDGYDGQIAPVIVNPSVVAELGGGGGGGGSTSYSPVTGGSIGNGGRGGKYGAGGGGGGGTRNSTSAFGNGQVGGGGIVIVVTYHRAPLV